MDQQQQKTLHGDIPAVVTTILAALSMQLSAKPTDLVLLAQGEESAPHCRLWKWESNCKVTLAGELVLLKLSG